MIRFSKYLITLIALIIALHASAFTLTSPNDLILTISPASPRAGASFAATAKSFAFDALRARFRWFLNSKEIAAGIGLIEQTFTAGKLGSQMHIRVTATAADGNFYEASENVAVADIDFIINPLTYTPSFYRGAALPTPGSVVEIIAVPYLYPASPAGGSQGAKLNSQNLIYEWSLDNKPALAQSGGGKNKLTLKLADVGNSNYVVALKIHSLDGGVFAQKSTRVKTHEPQIIFYETNALTGLNSRAITSFWGIAGNTFSILAEPFFFDLDSLTRAKIVWSANGEVINPSSSEIRKPRLLDLSAPAGTKSQTNFSLKIEDEKTIFQQAEATISVTASP